MKELDIAQLDAVTGGVTYGSNPVAVNLNSPAPRPAGNGFDWPSGRVAQQYLDKRRFPTF